ncbi:hypothetical protein Mp_3g18360 [Marchantia polymorpha subsp. ruderalis]|uniref:Uncharacterized protein n=2 Tax=Marchantia polymorpha TaxID=3197 RepID=A0AAF6B265_MARPO|nr:hypothetical protein MARPO_0140s0006 [Marchantia polymorpha]BBN06099.1 hypothetical protein Mp_3g18360 [Marchantia polymorpha subsp. ruderalis]|eukprot:PTQ29469.1 hypothetical protein MARPO_0140s0006 [Marchantia polymorpha]
MTATRGRGRGRGGEEEEEGGGGGGIDALYTESGFRFLREEVTRRQAPAFHLIALRVLLFAASAAGAAAAGREAGREGVRGRDGNGRGGPEARQERDDGCGEIVRDGVGRIARRGETAENVARRSESRWNRVHRVCFVFLAAAAAGPPPAAPAAAGGAAATAPQDSG